MSDQPLTNEQARAILIEAQRQVDWYNFGAVVAALGDQGFPWGKYHNGRWTPNYTQMAKELKWLTNNFDKILEALDYLKDNR